MHCFSCFTVDNSQQMLGTLVRSDCAVDFSFCAKITIDSCFSEAELENTSFLLTAMAAFTSKSPKLQVRSDTLGASVCMPGGCRGGGGGARVSPQFGCQGLPPPEQRLCRSRYVFASVPPRSGSTVHPLRVLGRAV